MFTVWVDACMYGWMHVCMDICIYILIPFFYVIGPPLDPEAYTASRLEPLLGIAELEEMRLTEDAMCSTEIITSACLNHEYAKKLGDENLTFMNGHVTDPIATSTPVNTLSGGLGPTVPTYSCLKLDDITLVKSIVYLCVKNVVHHRLVAECFGCTVDHPSQRRHSCLYEPPAYYFAAHYDDICEALLIPALTNALGYALHAVYGKTVHGERLLGAAEVIVSEMRSEPYIIEGLDRAMKDIGEGFSIHVLDTSLSLWAAGNGYDHTVGT